VGGGSHPSCRSGVLSWCLRCEGGGSVDGGGGELAVMTRHGGELAVMTHHGGELAVTTRHGGDSNSCDNRLLLISRHLQ
jgi:hypothetical protein